MSIIEKLNIESGSIASPSIIFRETTTGLSANGGDLSLSMGGVERLKLSNAGILSLPGYSGNNGKYLKMDASGVLSADTPTGGGTSGSEAIYSGFAVKQDGLESASTSVYASKINKNITLFFAANQVNLSATTNTIKSRIFPNNTLYPNMSYNYSKPVFINNKQEYARFVKNYNEYYLEFFTFPTLAWVAGTPITIQPFTITYVGANDTALTGTTWGTTYFDTVVPTISTLSPTLNELNVALNSNYAITFSENIAKGLTGNVTIKVIGGGILATISITNTSITISGATLTIPAQAIVANTNYCILIESGAVTDVAGNPFTGIVSEAIWQFTSADTIAPSHTLLSPALNSTNIDNNTILVVTFNEPIVKGIGFITIRVFGGINFEVIDITDSKCTITSNILTINPAGSLVDNAVYEILMDAGAIKDSAGNSHTGILAGNWKFTCLGITSPPSGSTVWVDGSDPLNNGSAPTNGAVVTTWFDKSGNSNNMIASVNGTYSSNSQNGLGTIAFNQSYYTNNSSSTLFFSSYDVYVVVKLNSLYHNDVCGVENNDGFNSLTFGEYTASKWHNGSNGFSRTPNAVSSVTETSTSFLIMSWSIANNNFYIYRNGVQIMITSSYIYTEDEAWFSLGTRTYYSGVATAGRLIGNIAEVILYPSQLNTTNRQLAEGYLANKWGLKSLLPTGHPYAQEVSITAFSIPSLITTSGESRTVTITFSENVYNFTIADLTPTGGTLGPLSGSGSSYSVVFTSNATTPRTLQIIAGGYTNVGGIVGPGQTLNLSTPTSPPTGPILWVDGSNPLNTGVPPTNGAAVPIWYDKSGNSNNMAAVVNGTYSSNIQNGLGAITFSLSRYRSFITNIPYYPVDVYLVVKVNTISTPNDICSVCRVGIDDFNSLSISQYGGTKWSNTSSGFSRTPNAVASVTETSTSFLIMSWSIANGNYYIYRNGVQIAATSSYSWTPTLPMVFSLGTRTDINIIGDQLVGSIAEAIVYTSQLNTTNRQSVEGYLANKWGLKSLLPADHPYKA